MIKNHYKKPQIPRRVVILGGGFISKSLEKNLLNNKINFITLNRKIINFHSKNSIIKVGMPKVFIELGNEIPRAVLIPTLNELNPPGPKATARSVISEISILETFKHFFIFGISSRLWF